MSAKGRRRVDFGLQSDPAVDTCLLALAVLESTLQTGLAWNSDLPVFASQTLGLKGCAIAAAASASRLARFLNLSVFYFFSLQTGTIIGFALPYSCDDELISCL